jgi:uncharacterized membrane protein YgdD (TMEM256/DUF423 family)
MAEGDGSDRVTGSDGTPGRERGRGPGTGAARARTGAAGAVLAGLAVGLGAFGAHGLSDVLAPARLATFETAVRYQMFHALGLLAVAALGGRALTAAPWLLAGSLVFSGSLYLLVFTDTGWWGAAAPVGGLLQIAGWLLLAARLLRGSRPDAG